MDEEKINKIFEDCEISYVKYVMDMTSDVRRIGNLINESNDQIVPAAVNTALALYLNTNIAVLSEYQRQKITYENIQLAYDLWYSEQYEKAKIQVQSEYQEKSIKPAVKEYDTRVMTMDPTLYTEKNVELKTSLDRMRFMLHLREILASYDRILTTISSNMRQEMVSLSLDNRMNATPGGVYTNKIRTEYPEKDKRVSV